MGEDARIIKHQEFDEMEVPMYNIKDVEYLSNIYLGTPSSQKVKVVLDSGSNWLTVKSCLTPGKLCHKGPKKVKDPVTGKEKEQTNEKGE